MLRTDLDQHDPGSLNKQTAQIAIAASRDAAEDRAVAGRYLLSRPFEKASPVPIAATIALEMIGPMPGTVISRSQPLS
jgi:hypothetical protein